MLSTGLDNNPKKAGLQDRAEAFLFQRPSAKATAKTRIFARVIEVSGG